MSFGWSAGDLITGISFLAKIFRALDDSKGGKAAYSELARELSSLKDALETIGDHRTATESPPESPINKAIDACQKCIDTFISRMKKFKGMDKDHNGSRWSLETFKKNARAVEWILCKKTEIDDFRRAVQFHAVAILSLQISTLRY